MPLILSISIFVLQSMVHPYESTMANYLESFLFLWLVCLLGLFNTSALQDELKTMKQMSGEDFEPKWPKALLYIPVALGLLVLLIVLVLTFRYSSPRPPVIQFP